MQAPFERFQRFDPGPIFDEDFANGDVEMQTVEHSRRWIVAVDFGTTFSSVAYCSLAEGENRGGINLMDLKCITRYPDDEPVPEVTWAWQPRLDVPTEIWYSSKLPRHRAGRHCTQLGLDEGQSSNEDPTDSDCSSLLSLSSSGDEDENEPEEGSAEVVNTTSHVLSWGFGVQRQLKKTSAPKDNTRRIARFKLMLDEKSKDTEHIRGELLTTFRVLKRTKLIKENADVIADYLVQLFTHTKNQLQLSEGFQGSDPIEFVLCVPAIWTAKACRIMQTTMAKAALRSGLGSLHHGNLNDLFIVSEPEAAAACVLAESNHDICPGETIVLVDAGGGTVDAVTYRVTNYYPLRLAAEEARPGSKLCGASYINERFEALLLKKLKHEQYLVKNGKTIQRIVDAKVMNFENGYKRTIDVTDKKFHVPPVDIDDLRPNPKKGLHQNLLELTRKEIEWVYKFSLDGAATVLTEQLEIAKAKGLIVQKVILIGGFGQSPSLRSHLKKVLANFQDREIAFLTPESSSTAVARGAVLRALNKEVGPSRVTQCSYGFLRDEPFAPKLCEAHTHVKAPTVDKADGEKYVEGTIHWLIQKGDALPNRREVSIPMKHTFKEGRQKFLCEEKVYVSDYRHESHYRRTHPLNKGAEVAGQICVNMSFLKTEGHIQPKPPSDYSKHSDPKHLHWDVEYDLVMIVDGRNLYYEARWPSLTSTTASQQQHVQARGQLCITPAFQPGTA